MVSRRIAGKPDCWEARGKDCPHKTGRQDVVMSFKYLLQRIPPGAGAGQKEGPTECLRLLGHSINDRSVLNLLCDLGLVRHQ